MITTIEYKIEISDIDTEEKLKKFYPEFFKKLDKKIKKGNNVIIKTCKHNVAHNTLKRDIEVHIELLENHKEVLKRIHFVEYKNDTYCLPINMKFELDTKTVQQIHITILKLLEEGKDVVLDFNNIETLTNDIIFELIGKTILGLYDKNKITNLDKLKFINTNDYLKAEFKELYEASTRFFTFKGTPRTITPNYI